MQPKDYIYIFHQSAVGLRNQKSREDELKFHLPSSTRRWNFLDSVDGEDISKVKKGER